MDDDFYALQVLSTMLGGGMSSRLFQEVRENRGLAYSVFSFPSCYNDTGVLGIYAGTGEESRARPAGVRRVPEADRPAREPRARAAARSSRQASMMALESCLPRARSSRASC